MNRQLITNTIVSHWFGDAFTELHPLLQKLHLHGGQLKGRVQIVFGRGVAHWVGCRLARKLGVPSNVKTAILVVDISHSDNALLWNRTFQTADGTGTTMYSTFSPVGSYPDGYWREATGKLTLHLGVDIAGGGWRWVQRDVQFAGISMPAVLLPSTRAYKSIENGQYRFEVAVHMPLLGEVLRYGGVLYMENQP